MLNSIKYSAVIVMSKLRKILEKNEEMIEQVYNTITTLDRDDLDGTAIGILINIRIYAIGIINAINLLLSK